jgi:hypothetical protein
MKSLIASGLFLYSFALLSATGRSYTEPNDTTPGVQSNVVQKTYTTTRLGTQKPVIDGVPDDECWKTGNWGGDFIQWIPSEGGVPSMPTKFKVIYDDKNIYVVIICIDREPGKIQRYAGLRDQQIGDMTGIDFDSYHDKRTGFEFNLTAYGQKIDLILTNPMNPDDSWNPVWSGKVSVNDSAWVAEMEIPLNQIRYSNEEVQVWGMHVWRWIGRLSEEDDWEHQTLTGPGMLYNFGEIRGISGLKKSRRLEIMPYALGQLKTFEKQPGNPFADKGSLLNGNAGLDVKLGVSSNFTVDMSFNPDFGQVESDPSVMNLTAFETFYEEKRPFFLEAKNIFKYDFDDMNLFYSRRIGHSPSYSVPTGDTLYSDAPNRTTILSAIKLSGKTAGGLSVGLLQSLTAPEEASLSTLDGIRSRQTIEPLTNYMVARVQKDYNQGTTMLGGILTSANRFINDPQLQFLTRDAYTGGLDLLHQWKDKKYYIDSRLVGSYVNGDRTAMMALQESSARYFQRPGAGYLDMDSARSQLSGFGGKFRIGKGSGLWRYSSGVSWYSPGLELNDLGYMQMADLVQQENEVSYFVNQPVSIFRMYSVDLEQFSFWNFNGDYLGVGGHLSLFGDFKNKWQAHGNIIWESESIDTRMLRGGYNMKLPAALHTFGMINTDASKRVFGGFSFETGYRAEQSLNSYNIEPSLSIRPVNTLKIQMAANYGKNRDDMQYVTTISNPSGNKYILGRINQETLGFTFRLDYSIRPEFTISYYGSPFVSKGSYKYYREVVDPLSEEYADRCAPYNGNIGNPDFNFHQFRSNLVAKWEFRPGSFAYLVWADERTGLANPSGTDVLNSMNQLWKLYPGNLFLIKINYWFSL